MREVELAQDVADVAKHRVRLHERADDAEKRVLAVRRHYAEQHQRHQVVDHVDVPAGRAIGRQQFARRLEGVTTGVDGTHDVERSGVFVEQERLPKNLRRTEERRDDEKPRH